MPPMPMAASHEPDPDANRPNYAYNLSDRYRQAVGLTPEEYATGGRGGGLASSPKLILDTFDAVLNNTVGAMTNGFADMQSGNYFRGARDVGYGAGMTAAGMVAPQMLEAVWAAPIQMLSRIALTAGPLAITHPLVQKIGQDNGLTRDQAGLLADTVTTALGYPAGKLANAGMTKLETAAAGRAAVKLPEQVRTLREKVFKSTASRPYTEDEFNEAVAVYRHFNKGKLPSTPEEFEEGLNVARSEIEKIVAEANAAYPGETIDTDPWQSALRALQGSDNKTFVERGMALLAKEYPQLKGPLTLTEADKLRNTLTSANKPALEANSYNRHQARMNDPEYAAREAALDALRDGNYDKLEELGVTGIRELRKTEGAVLNIRNSAEFYSRTGHSEISGSGPGIVKQALGWSLGKAANLATGSPLASVPVRWATDKFLPGTMTRNQLFGVTMQLAGKLPSKPFVTPVIPTLPQPSLPPSSSATTATRTGMAQSPSPNQFTVSTRGGPAAPAAPAAPVTPTAPVAPAAPVAAGLREADLTATERAYVGALTRGGIGREQSMGIIAQQRLAAAARAGQPAAPAAPAGPAAPVVNQGTAPVGTVGFAVPVPPPVDARTIRSGTSMDPAAIAAQEITPVAPPTGTMGVTMSQPQVDPRTVQSGTGMAPGPIAGPLEVPPGTLPFRVPAQPVGPRVTARPEPTPAPTPQPEPVPTPTPKPAAAARPELSPEEIEAAGSEVRAAVRDLGDNPSRDALLKVYLERARKDGFTGTVKAFREQFNAAHRQAQQLIDDLTAEAVGDDPAELLRFIAKRGGIGDDSWANKGVTSKIDEEVKLVRRGRSNKSGRPWRRGVSANTGMIGGVDRVRTKDGMSMSKMAEALQEARPEWRHIDDEQELEQAILDAVHKINKGHGTLPTFKITDALEQKGVMAGRPWWEDFMDEMSFPKVEPGPSSPGASSGLDDQLRRRYTKDGGWEK
jgi:hypothetical protein